MTHDIMIIWYHITFNSIHAGIIKGVYFFSLVSGLQRVVKQGFTSNSTIRHCNHLTHFAILLSAQPLVNDVLSQPQILALQVTATLVCLSH